VTLTLRNAPAKDALMAIAQLGGYGFVFVDDGATSSARSSVATTSTGTPQGASAAAPVQESGRMVTISFRNESYSRALNSVLLAAGLQGKKEGNMILAGPSVLGKSFGPQMSKVYRLNQASAASAADYLASLGANISKVNTLTSTSSQSADEGTPSANASATTSVTETLTSVESYGASTGPLKGLSGTTDSRLQTITLIGDAQLVAVAENYLRQLDLRQRQVALSVKILDVTLANDLTIDNSFAFRTGNTFIVNNDGRLSGFFGDYLPPKVNPATGGVTQPSQNPGNDYPTNQLYDFLSAQIQSTSTKVLASPTLILSENPEAIKGGVEVSAGGGSNSVLNTASIGRPFANESFVTVGTQVITDYTVQAGQNGAPNTCQPEFGTAGLTFGARVSKIDDNGFVTFALSPAVSAISSTADVSGCGNINILSVRRLDTGTVRVRDGQTLILTGVISDTDAQAVKKWPIVGDIPFIGQFFRSSGGSRQKNELVIMVTPRIVNDEEGGAYGYGYRPASAEARRVMAD
jgi:type IV pilus assembly protein PilQ